MDTLEFLRKVFDWITAYYEGPDIYELSYFLKNIKNRAIMKAVKQIIEEIDEIGNNMEHESEFLENLYKKAELIYENLEDQYLNKRNYNICMEAIELEFKTFKLRKQMEMDINI